MSTSTDPTMPPETLSKYLEHLGQNIRAVLELVERHPDLFPAYPETLEAMRAFLVTIERLQK